MLRNKKSRRQQALDYAEKSYAVLQRPVDDQRTFPYDLHERVEEHLQAAIDLLKDGRLGQWARYHHGFHPIRNSRRSSRRRTSRRR